MSLIGEDEWAAGRWAHRVLDLIEWAERGTMYRLTWERHSEEYRAMMLQRSKEASWALRYLQREYPRDRGS